MNNFYRTLFEGQVFHYRMNIFQGLYDFYNQRYNLKYILLKYNIINYVLII